MQVNHCVSSNNKIEGLPRNSCVVNVRLALVIVRCIGHRKTGKIYVAKIIERVTFGI